MAEGTAALHIASVQQAILRSRALRHAHKRVLEALVEDAGDTREATLSARELMNVTGLCRSAVFGALRLLEALEIIGRERILADSRRVRVLLFEDGPSLTRLLEAGWINATPVHGSGPPSTGVDPPHTIFNARDARARRAGARQIVEEGSLTPPPSPIPSPLPPTREAAGDRGNGRGESLDGAAARAEWRRVARLALLRWDHFHGKGRGDPLKPAHLAIVLRVLEQGADPETVLAVPEAAMRTGKNNTADRRTVHQLFADLDRMNAIVSAAHGEPRDPRCPAERASAPPYPGQERLSGLEAPSHDPPASRTRQKAASAVQTGAAESAPVFSGEALKTFLREQGWIDPETSSGGLDAAASSGEEPRPREHLNGASS